jgi:hypothetical protein
VRPGVPRLLASVFFAVVCLLASVLVLGLGFFFFFFWLLASVLVFGLGVFFLFFFVTERIGEPRGMSSVNKQFHIADRLEAGVRVSRWVSSPV